MIRYKLNLFCLCVAGLLACLFNPVQAFTDSECRALQVDENQPEYTESFSKGLLWEVSRANAESSHVFGTIHVSDKSILALPSEVSSVLNQSDSFIMEALPEPSEVILLANTMFYTDGRRLDTMVPQAIFHRTVEILHAYHMPAEAVSIMKPWAAFLTMNYPANEGTVLDLKLLEIARKNGAQVHGLETLQEQGEIFNQMPLNDQIVLLKDTVCHYDIVLDDFEKMKLLYLQRDLEGLYQYAQRYVFADNSVYQKLTDKLLTERNYTMTERMQPLLRQGNAFIAVGAMHLAGEEGILSLLTKQGYKVNRVY